MKTFSEKVYLTIAPPTEDDSLSDQQRICEALSQRGYDNVKIPLPLLRRLYPQCRDWGYRFTATLVCREEDWLMTAIEPGDTTATHYGLAMDYGSTTMLMQLVDLTSGAVIAQAREMNGQIRYGTDILTRITYTMEDPQHPEDLRRVTAETISLLLDDLTEESGIDARQCPVLIVSGNTTMIHFLLKLNAWTVFASPFAPVTNAPGWFDGGELGLDFPGVVYIIPSASNYIGGDIVSGLLVLGMEKSEGIRLFFDIGTNGELVIGNREWIMGGAGAAGPALEGYISRYGIQAQDGAIDTVTINGASLHFTTIGNQKPVGICGSGIIDLLAQMRLNGWIDIAGQLDPAASDRIVYLEEEAQYVAVYAHREESGIGQPLYFSQTDIDQYLDTKAAAYTMIQCLLETAGCGIADIADICLSGSFSAHSDLESAITIGIFPDLPREKYSLIANASLDGARTLLLNRERMADIHRYAETMYCVQFASVPDFLVRMQAAKFIPHTDMDTFPSIQKKLNHQN